MRRRSLVGWDHRTPSPGYPRARTATGPRVPRGAHRVPLGAFGCRTSRRIRRRRRPGSPSNRAKRSRPGFDTSASSGASDSLATVPAPPDGREQHAVHAEPAPSATESGGTGPMIEAEERPSDHERSRPVDGGEGGESNGIEPARAENRIRARCRRRNGRRNGRRRRRRRARRARRARRIRGAPRRWRLSSPCAARPSRRRARGRPGLPRRRLRRQTPSPRSPPPAPTTPAGPSSRRSNSYSFAPVRLPRSRPH